MAGENMNIAIIKLKRRVMMMVFFLRMFLIGVEYSVILPTALLYIKALDGTHTSMGLVVAAYPFAGFIALPIFGYLYDHTLRIKELLFILNLFQIVGNILYSLHYSVAFPILGRLVAGVGDGFSALAMGEMAHLYSPSERIGMFSLLELGRVFGLIVGPTLNFFVAEKHFMIDTWILDNKTLPGVIMALSWTLLEVCTLIGVFNLSREILLESSVQEFEPVVQPDNHDDVISNNGDDVISNRDMEIDDDERLSEPLFDEDIFTDNDIQYKEAVPPSLSEKHFAVCNEKKPKVSKFSLKEYFLLLKDILSFEFFVLFYIEINLTVIQNVFEVLLPYITEFDYHWVPKQTGVVYIIAGFELLLIFLSIYAIGHKILINDAYMVLLTLIVSQISLGLLIYESVPKSIHDRVIIFTVMAVSVIFSIPFNLVSMKSLLTKMLSPDAQGIVQGIYGSVSRFALILAPLISSAVFENRQAFGGIASVTNFAGILFMFACLGRINRQQEKMSASMIFGVEK